jgi:gliding motility-associated-like protein
VQLINNSTVLGNNTYNWKIDNLYQLSDINPIISLSKVGKHSITLIASTSEGCKDQISKTIELKNDFNVFIPSSFTPNFDKINDEFKPIFSPFGLDTKHYEMEIFNRWGQSLFRTTDVNKGWDGSLQNNSESLKEEVYVYKIKYKDLDGNFYNKMGHLTLLK